MNKNQGHLTIAWEIYEVQLNRWKVSSQWVLPFSPERKMHTSVKFQGRTNWIGKYMDKALFASGI